MTQNLSNKSNSSMTQEYQFTQSWFLNVCQYWPWLFNSLSWNNKDPKMILEIGSFEGQSTCWMLENLIENENSKIFCLDLFQRDEEQFERFTHNISVTKKEDLVSVLVGDSKYNLSELVCQGLSFVLYLGRWFSPSQRCFSRCCFKLDVVEKRWCYHF